MATERKQINVRIDDDVLAAIGELQSLVADPLAPSVAEIVRRAILEMLERKRKGRK